MSEYILEIKNLSKTFPGVKALDDVSISIKEGETHALCGENGAGKSTLINVLCGVHAYGSYDGELFVNGVPVKFASIRDSEKKRIVCIHQELALAPDLSVAENIFMGRLPNKFGVTRKMEINDEARKWLERLGLRDEARGIMIDPEDIVANLGIGQQQLVEIAKALSKNARILILDEPTSALTEKEVDILFNVIRDLKSNNITCILISHKLNEIMEIADSVSILRDGQHIASKQIEDITEEELISLMVGRQLSNLYDKKKHERGEVSFEIKNYTVYDPLVSDKRIVDNVSLKAYKGEILGITGLIGSGRTELFSSVYGGYKGKHVGEVFINGKKMEIRCPKDAIRSGLFYLHEDRKGCSIFPDMQVKENTTISSIKKMSVAGVINSGKEIRLATKQNEELKTRMSSVETLIINLSGGNQQKVMLARALMCEPSILILDEPTRGIDIGAKQEIYRIISNLVDAGVTVILISSEMEEVMGVSDRIIVFGQGKIKGELQYGKYSQEKILAMGIA